MYKLKLRNLIALVCAGLAWSAVGGAYGQYSITGQTAGGGNIIIGDGSLGALGPGSPLSAGGGDSVTLNIGSVATANSPFVIEFITQNDSLTNNGSILGAAGPGLGGSGVLFSSLGDITNLDPSILSVIGTPATNLSGIRVANNGVIAGGSAADFDLIPGSIGGAIGGSGILALVGNDLVDMQTTNSGSITGGSVLATGTDTAQIGIGGSGLLSIAVHDTNGFQLFNTGNITGGTANSSGPLAAVSLGGAGILVGSGHNIENTSIGNAGTIAGGAANADSPSGEASVSLGGAGAMFLALNSLENFNFTNLGNLIGGSSSATGAASLDIALGGIGLWLHGSSVNQVSLMNSNTGNIVGGSVNADSNSGILVALAGDGVLVSSINLGPLESLIDGLLSTSLNIFPDTANISNVTLVNQGNISGGNLINGDNFLSLGSTGVSFLAVSFTGTSANAGISNVSVKNYGTIAGGSGGTAGIGGDGLAFTALNLSNIGSAISLSGMTVNFDLAALGSDVPITNVKVDNYGTIKGGNGGAGSAGGNAISIIGGNSSSGIVVNNSGALIGGDAGAGGVAGNGIFSFASGLTVNNLGLIAGGSGGAGAAIQITGNNNTVNLFGHSSTVGSINASGTNNVLNIKLTGVNPAAAAQFIAQLQAEGIPVNTGEYSSGSASIRGTTINWDPLIVNVSLSSYQAQGLTPNQQAVGASLDSLFINPAIGSDLLTMFNAIDASGNVPLALEQLSPQRYQIYGDIALANQTFLTLEVDNRLNNLRDGSESIDTTGIGGGTDKTTAGYSKDGKSVEVPEAKAPEKHWGFWASGSGIFSNVDGHGGDLTDAYFTTSNFVLGVDGKVNDNLVLGLLFNYDHTEADLDNQGSSARVDTYGGGVYAGFHDGGWYANGLATYGHNSYDSWRNVLIPGFNRQAVGSTDGNQYSADIDGGYDFKVNDSITVGPLVGLQYVRLDVDGFNEFGAGAADLAVGSQSVDSLRSRLGFRVDYHKQISKEVAFATELRAAWQHEFLDDSRGITSSFIGSGLGAFTVETTNPQRDSVLAGVGVNITVRDTMTIFFDYDVQAGQESYLENSVKGGLKFSF